MTKTCYADSCAKPVSARGLCKSDYEYLRKNGTLERKRNSPRSGHITADGYREIFVGGRRVLEHRYVMEQHLGRALLPGEEVHRLDGDKLNNSIENLYVASKQSPRYHRRTGHVNSNGYRLITVDGRGMVLEHRYIMEQRIGRELLPEETVHHKDGDRLNNHIDNLELWTSRHPRGQRIEDKVQFAQEILRLYAPSLLNQENLP